MKRLLNDGWSYAKLPAGSSMDDAKKASFAMVDLPHDWLIWQENDLYESADAWYCRRIDYIQDPENPVTLLRFDGVYMDCDIILNGKILLTHPYGYTAFTVSLTGLLRNGENELMVHIRHISPNSRWYSGSGIIRDVYLLSYPMNYLIPDGLNIQETDQGDGRWLLSVNHETAGSDSMPFFCALSDADGKQTAGTEGCCSGNTARAELTVTDAQLWSPESPYLYTLTLKYGKQTEVYRIGLRSVAISPNNGFILNGKHMKLKGVCLHHDLGALGAAFHIKAAKRQLMLMKKMGANAVRTSHNPPASAFLDLCDEIGMLVVDEAFDMWERNKTQYDYARFFDEWAKKDVASWVRRDRCHPSVIMWSIGNEIYDMHADQRGTEVTRMLAHEVRKHDPFIHAYTTFGCNYMPWEGGQRCAGYVDAVGYNYGEKYYELHHRDHPEWVIYGSETASILSSRGVYHFPIGQSIMAEADQQCSALGNSNTSWGAESLQKIIIDDIRNPYSLGQFIWSGIDYIGEPTPYHTRSCYFGQADTACYPKDSFYLFQSFWTEQKMIHIGVTWDWNQGQMIDIPVYTNCCKAELFLNGVSQGVIKPDRNDPQYAVPVWKIPFASGTLTVCGLDEDNTILCEDTRITPGEPVQLKLSCENEFMLSDGKDLIFVNVTAVDTDNVPVENARERIKVHVSGGGRLVGTDNGDSTDPDGYKSDCRRLFNGKLLLIIASNGINQPVVISVTGNQCRGAGISVPTLKADPPEGSSCCQMISEHAMNHEISVRKLEICPLDGNHLTPDHPSSCFSYRILPAEAENYQVYWEITNSAGIESPFVKASTDQHTVTVTASGDGQYYLRGLCHEPDRTILISQIEFSAAGFGNPALNPYSYLSAGLYDLHEGDIGTGNEKGISFARDGESMVGFSMTDFGKEGSDTLTADLFALNSDPYDMELWAGRPDEKPRFISVLHYQKPSIWNVYQSETWHLPVRLTGVMTLLFRMKDKVHFKGFSFERQSFAYIPHNAADADSVYGDSFSIEGNDVTGIGNNVTLTWNNMEFGGEQEVLLQIRGSTPLPVNSIRISIRNEQGESVAAVADFDGNGGPEQIFTIPVLSGCCSVSFVFLPGSQFDFSAFRFYQKENWTGKK